jgi:ankyrin repeat protein
LLIDARLALEAKNANNDDNDNATTTTTTKVRRRDGKTALHWAARNGHANCVALLMSYDRPALFNVDEPTGGISSFDYVCLFC